MTEIPDLDTTVEVQFDDVSEYIAVLEAAKTVGAYPSDIIAEIVSENIRDYKLQLEEQNTKHEQQQQIQQMAQMIPDDANLQDLQNALEEL